jgi:DNA-binding SARP family transcriptional activator/ATP/maltotriose-dependent transcriptional regulator MalT
MDTTLPPPAAAGPDLLRTALIERVRAARPAIVSLVAPAGFGKSTFVRQLLDGAAFAVCDCRGVSSDVDLARRLLPALADENPERAANLSQTEAMLGDGHASAADRVGVALAAWRVRPPGASAFVFENTEDAIADPGARELLAKLLASRTDGRTIVVCSRESLRMHLSRFAPPHQILSLRASDLAFSMEEIDAIFRPTRASAECVVRVASISAGWPIAVLLLARFAHEGRLEPLLDKLDDVAYEELHEYLADQVLGDASPAVTDGLLASAGIPHASERDVRLALGDDAAFDAFLAFTKTSPFVTRGADGTFAVHPLVASTLLERHPARADTLLAPAAAAYESAAEYQRAAEIHLGRGDQRAAADALEHIEVIDEGPQIGYARVLASLDRDIVLRHSRLWSVTALARTFSVDSRLLHDEVESMWAKLPPDAPAMERIHLYVFRVLMLSYVGEYESALALVDEFRAQIAAPDVPQTRMHAWLLYLRSLMTARLGRTKEAEFDLEAAWPFINGMPLMAGGTLVTLGADVARVRGDRASERERIERAIEYARSTGFGNFVAFYEAEAAFGAWFAGDDTDFVQHAFALEAVVEREGVRGFAFFTACARGHAAEPQPADQTKWIALGYLIAAANAGDPATALRYADVARETASSSRSPFYQVLAALAVAELNPARRSALRAEAAALAARIDAVELHEAIDALARGEHGGFLEPFVRRYRGDAGAEAPRGGLLVELVTGRVVRDGQVIALAEREHALLTAVAMRAEALSRDRLTDLLWPDLGESAARNAFHVCLHRLKSRLGDDNVVVRTRDGYRLGSEVRVDLWEIDRGLATLRTDGALDARQAAGLREAYDRLRASRPPKFEGWEWFEQTERHLRELRCEVAQALAKHALAEHRTQDALALCHEMIAYDPCDEPAREIAIRAYLESGDRAAALRHFRQYRDVLAAELQCEPSDALAKLVGATS